MFPFRIINMQRKILKKGRQMVQKKDRFTCRIAVYLYLTDGNNILLAQRKNTGFADGFYSCVSGHLDPQESLIHAMIREAHEEIGIVIAPHDLQVVHVMHHKSSHDYVDFYFGCSSFEGTLMNCEPEKCSEIRFFPKNNLPQNLVPNVAQAINHIEINSYYSQYGWD